MEFNRRLRAWLREPLLHFLVLGGVIYIALAGRAPDAGERRIVVDEAVVARLVERWSLAFRRVPSRPEIDGLIRDYVQDEVYYREALRLGLDRDDDAVRRRMRNKMLALATGAAEAVTPSDTQLQALLDKDPAHYARDLRYDFRQVYLGPDNPASVAAAGQLLASARSGADPAPRAQPIPLPLSFVAVTTTAVIDQFGDRFEQALRSAKPGEWSGPVRSGFGLHLVKLGRRLAPTPPRLADVRQQVENDWRAAMLADAQQRAYADMLKGYDVVIDVPK